MASHASETLGRLMTERTVAALGTVADGDPYVSMVPFALSPDGRGVLIHVSHLAAHTRQLLAHPSVSLMVMGPESAEVIPQALPRATLQCQARVVEPTDPNREEAVSAYLERFPSARDLFGFPDFLLIQLEVQSARVVSGFAQATTLNADAFRRAVDLGSE